MYKGNFYAGIACSQTFSLCYLSSLHLGSIFIYRGFYFHSRTRLSFKKNRWSVISLTNSCKVFFFAVVQMHLSFYIASKTVRKKLPRLNAIWIDGRYFKHINYRIKDEELGRSYWRDVKVGDLRGVDRVSTGDCMRNRKASRSLLKGRKIPPEPLISLIICNVIDH